MATFHAEPAWIAYSDLSPVSPGETNFILPIDLNDIDLAGNFGEIRTNHFHSGIDIRTQGTEGFPVLAAEDGYVARIKVRETGFGHALYIAHPNGYTSVYAHLQRFNEAIQQFLRQVQYRQQSFKVDIYPKTNKFPVKKGDTIAFSGNSGSSSGPHLHFELRKSLTQEPVNPLLFGYALGDDRSPVLGGIGLYQMVWDTVLRHFRTIEDKFFYVRKYSDKYRVKHAEPLPVCRAFGVSINGYDLLHKYGRRLGLYAVRMYLDDELLYSHQKDKIGYPVTRYVNAHIDYNSKVRRGKTYERCFVLPGNGLDIYPVRKNNGIIELTDHKVHTIRLEVLDAAGNTSELRFKVQRQRDCAAEYTYPDEETVVFRHDQSNVFERDGLYLDVPKGALYAPLYFTYQYFADRTPEGLSGTHRLHQGEVPMHKYATLRFQPDALPVSLRKHALLGQVYRNRRFSASGGGWNENHEAVQARIRDFGDYTVGVDTTAPRIRFLNIRNGKNMRDQRSIRVSITDNRSGIAAFRGEVNGKWILMEYDKKYNLLKHTFDDRISAGEHIFKITVTDRKGNIATREARFSR